MADAMPKPGGEVVVDVGRSDFSDLWKKEDYWAIWLGFIILIVGLIIFLSNPPAKMEETFKKANETMKAEAAKAPFKTIAWHQASQSKGSVRGTSQGFARDMIAFLAAPAGWSSNPLDALIQTQAEADAKNAKAKDAAAKAVEAEKAALAKAKTSEEAAAKAQFKDAKLNGQAEADIAAWRAAQGKAGSAKRKAANKPFNKIYTLIGLAIVLALFFSIGTYFLGRSIPAFIKGFFFVFLIAVLAYMMETQSTMKTYGFGFPLWAIIFGMLISNTIGTPNWVKPAVQTEYYIKTGLVLLGGEILFDKLLAIGLPGIVVAWFVTPIVLVWTFWFGQRVLKMPSKTLNITISSDMSVCGVSAAIATASACRAKKEELTLAVGLSMVFTAVMMVAMPAFIKAVGMNEVLGGAWMGGTIDATGAVAAAGAFLGQKALYTAATVKMIQNILIGIIAFCVAVYWCAKVDCVPGQQVSWWEIWYRFPKFVLGFICASLVFSLIFSSLGSDVGGALIDHGVLRGFSRLLREWFFALAFASIGLATDFRELAHHFKGGKPLILYVTGQSFNLCLTLLMAYIMFFLVFPEITARI